MTFLSEKRCYSSQPVFHNIARVGKTNIWMQILLQKNINVVLYKMLSGILRQRKY